MATGSILLPIGAVVLPDGSTSNLGPAMQRVKSSATAPAPIFCSLRLMRRTWSRPCGRSGCQPIMQQITLWSHCSGE
jgi:hypothetical protein